MVHFPIISAAVVAVAAPPNPNFTASTKSSTTLITVEHTIAISDVTLSCAPSRLVCRTFPNRYTGKIKLRISTYRTAGSRMAGLDQSLLRFFQLVYIGGSRTSQYVLVHFIT